MPCRVNHVSTDFHFVKSSLISEYRKQIGNREQREYLNASHGIIILFVLSFY